MKKRIYSLVLALVLLLSLCPVAALAEETEEYTGEPVEAAESVEAEPVAEPASEPEVTPEPTAEPETEPKAPAVDEAAAAQVQALLDALPDAETVTADTRAAVEAQLTAIDDARLALDDDSTLDYTRYAAIVAALEALDGIPGAGEPETLATTTVNDAGALKNAVASGGEITLGKDITLTSRLDIDKTVTLDLNGKKLTFSGSPSAIRINSGGTLTIKATGGGEIDISGAGVDDSYVGGIRVSDGIFNLTGGTITAGSNTKSSTAGAVTVAGTFNMSGGTITGGSTNAQFSAGGVYVTTGGVFNLSGGTITNCSTSAQNSGGGVYAVNGATVNISGSGTITNCSTTASYSGGGVYFKKSNSYTTTGGLTMSGGTISNCRSTGGSNSAGGVFVYDGGTFAMSNGKISGCSASGSGSAGGVYVGDNSEFNISRSDNTTIMIESCTTSANGSAGGVYVGSGGKFNMSGGRLYLCGAKAESFGSNSSLSYSAAGGVYVAAGGTFTMQNANISMCTFLIPSESNKVAPQGACAGGVVNNGTFTIGGSKSLIDYSYVYIRTMEVGQTDRNKYMYTKGLANTGTVHANDGRIDGIYNNGNVYCDSGESGTRFQVQDNLVEVGVYAKNYNANSGTIHGGVFEGAVYNEGVINGGTFRSSNGCTSSVTNKMIISGGTFEGEVKNANTVFASQITGGIFTGTVDNSVQYGTVSGGTFTGATRIKVCQICFELDGGTGTTPATQWRYNAAATEPEAANPTKSGYKFLGWYNGDTKFDFTSDVTSENDITLKAKWEKLPAVSATAPTAITGLVYNGSAQTLINTGSSTDGTMKYSLDQSGTYATALPTATDAGTYMVWYYAEGNGTTTSDSEKKSVSVTIEAKSIENVGVTVVDPTYNGAEQGPTVTVTDAARSQTLVEGTDYTIAAGTDEIGVSGATSATNVGNYNLVVEGKGNYTGSVPRTWSIQPQSITPQSLTARNKTYDGNTNAEVENVSFSGLAPDDMLTMGTDYTVSNAKFENANAGNDKTVTATVTLLNTDKTRNYTLASGDVSGQAKIGQKPVTAVITVADKQYDGLKTGATVTAEVNARDLISGDSITISGLTGSFVDAQVENDKTVNVDTGSKSITGTNSGNYNVTIPATAKGNIVNNWDPVEGTEFTATEPNANGWLNHDLTVTAADDYELSLTNTADGDWGTSLTGSAEGENSELEFYVRDKNTRRISKKVTVPYNLDKNTDSTGTTGSVAFVDRANWETFLNTITFGLFYKNEVTVKATATDALSGVDKIEYATSDEALTLEQVMAITDWTAMPESGVGVTVADAKKFVYFVRVTDKAGNVTYFSTDGAEYDTMLPAISGIEDGATYYTTRSVTVTDRNLESVKLNNDSQTVNNGAVTLTLAGNVDATYTITATDKAGNETVYTVTMKPISALTENVKTKDKSALEAAKTEFEKALEDFGDNLTEAEKTAINEAIERIEAALKAIEQIERAAQEKKAAQTGDNAMPVLYIVVIVLALGAIVALVVVKKKKA